MAWEEGSSSGSEAATPTGGLQELCDGPDADAVFPVALLDAEVACRRARLLVEVAEASLRALLAEDYARFDAQVGDCACHVRALLLCEVLADAGELAQALRGQLELLPAQVTGADRAWCAAAFTWYRDLPGPLKLLLAFCLLHLASREVVDKGTGLFLDKRMDEAQLCKDFGVSTRTARSVVHRAQKYASWASCGYLALLARRRCGEAVAAVAAAAVDLDGHHRAAMPCFLSFYLVLHGRPLLLLDLQGPPGPGLRLLTNMDGEEVEDWDGPVVHLYGLLRQDLRTAPRAAVADAVRGRGVGEALLVYAAHHPQLPGWEPNASPGLEARCGPLLSRDGRHLDEQWARYCGMELEALPFQTLHMKAVHGRRWLGA